MWQIGHGERVGDVVRRRHGVETEQQLHHRLHLLLLGAAVADHRALDLRRAVLDDRNRRLRRGEQRDAARVPQLQRAAHVLGEEDVLDRDALGAVPFEQLLQAGVNREQPFRKCRAGGSGQDAAGDEAVTAARGFDAAVAGAFRAGIDPENSHFLSGGFARRSRSARRRPGHASDASISFSSMSAFDQTFLVSSCSSMASISLTICCAGFPSSLT